MWECVTDIYPFIVVLSQYKFAFTILIILMGAGDVSNLPVSFKTQMSENILACFFSHLVYLYLFTIPDIDL